MSNNDAREDWAENVKPGDSCRVRWEGSTWDAWLGSWTGNGNAVVLMVAADGRLVPMVVGPQDVDPPKDAP